MVYRILFIGFNTCNKNLLFINYHQPYKYRIAILFEAINITDFHIIFIYLQKYYIQYIINLLTHSILERNIYIVT